MDIGAEETLVDDRGAGFLDGGDGDGAGEEVGGGGADDGDAQGWGREFGGGLDAEEFGAEGEDVGEGGFDGVSEAVARGGVGEGGGGWLGQHGRCWGRRGAIMSDMLWDFAVRRKQKCVGVAIKLGRA